MNKPEIIYHANQRIFSINFEGLKTAEEFAMVIKLSKDYIRNQPKSSVVALTNMQGMHFNKEVRDLIAEFISGNKPYMKVSAAFGIGPLLRIVYNGVTKLTGRDVRAFDTKEQALNWLISRQEVLA